MRRTALRRPLTRQQLRVVELLAGGFRYREIAVRLQCSLATVKYHIREAGLLVPGDGRPGARLIYWYRGASVDILCGDVALMPQRRILAG